MEILKKLGWPYWCVGLVMGVMVPLLANAIDVSAVVRFGGLLLVINGGIAITIGRLMARRQQPLWWLLIWPGLYLVGATLFLPQYTQYFALVYLCLSYLTVGLSTMPKRQTESKN